MSNELLTGDRHRATLIFEEAPQNHIEKVSQKSEISLASISATRALRIVARAEETGRRGKFYQSGFIGGAD